MNRTKLFFLYVIPAVLAFALSGVYTIVDGFFVGNSMGDLGLTAINIAYPAAALIQAVGTGIGMAGAIQMSVRRAQGREEEARRAFGGALLLLLAASTALTLIFTLAGRPVLALLGARGEVLAQGETYLRVIVLGAGLQVLGAGLIPFIRNMGGAVFSMAVMIAGFLTNLGLDYVFVWRWDLGMTGAALATILGQGVAALGAAGYFAVRRARPALAPRGQGVYSGVLRLALSPFGITFSPNITLILMNRFLLLHGGEEAVAAYACIAYVLAVAYLLLQGVGDGSQPLFSLYHGQGDAPLLRHTRNLAWVTGGVIALGATAALFGARGLVGAAFGASPQVTRTVAEVLPLLLAGTVFLSFTRVTTSMLYATERGSLSYVLVYAEPLLLLVLLAALPPVWGLGGVWAAQPLSQCLTAALACPLGRRALSPGRGKP